MVKKLTFHYFEKYVITCTPNTTSTVLFAYSNDLDSNTVLGVWDYDALGDISPHFTSFANIRFDVRKEDDIQYHSSWKDVHASISSHLPDSSLGFGDSNTGSDVLKMIEKFMDNSQSRICGSRIVILVKRYPNETDISKLVAKLRQYHVNLSIMYSITPSGGHHSETLYKLATATNGLCAFNYDSDFYYGVWYVPTCVWPFLIYAENPRISGQGNISLATMRVPLQNKYWLAMTVQDQMPIDVDETVKLTWSGVGSTYSNSLGVKPGSTSYGRFHGNYVGLQDELEQASYSMSLNYKYSDNSLKTLQIRVYSYFPVNYWIPYDN